MGSGAAQQLGGIDLIVSNAGANFSKSVELCTEDDWRANLELNLAAHWRIAQTAKPYLDRARNPVVIVIASNQAFRPLPNAFPYNAAKAALVALVQSLAIEWGPHIRAAGIAPEAIDADGYGVVSIPASILREARQSEAFIPSSASARRQRWARCTHYRCCLTADLGG